MRWSIPLLTCVVSSLAAYSSLAAPAITYIKFDGKPDGQRIGEHYSPLGAHFVNDYAGVHMPYRSCPTIKATSLAWSSPNVLVNECQDDRIHSSHNVPLVIWFDAPVAGVGMRLGRIRGSAPSATISLFDRAGNPRASKTVALADNFQTGTEVWDAAQTTQLVVIDYGDDSSPEALDDFAFQAGSGAPAADALKPLVVITSPLDNAVVANTPALLQGVVSDLSGVVATFKINGVPALLSPRMGGLGKPYYQFSFNVALKKGGNPVTAMAWDRAGNSASDSITIHYGPPHTISLTEFHLTQRGIMRQGAVNIDYPMIAGKFSIVRIRLDAKTSDGYSTYVNRVKLSLKRLEGLTPVDAGEFWGTSYSPYVSSFNSSWAMAGIHFWLNGVDVREPGYYRMIFQGYIGDTPVGAPMEIPAPENMIYFHRTRPLRIFVLPTEAPLYDQNLGMAHLEQTVRVLQFVKRAFPVAADGIDCLTAPPLPMGDGSAAMDAAQDYIAGTGFEWTFKDDDPSGIWRAPHNKVFEGGQIQAGPLINLPRPSPYGLFRPGVPPEWKPSKNELTKRYPIPMDDNHDGAIADDMPNYMAEFFNVVPGGASGWSVNFAQYDQGESFRGYRDLNLDSKYNIGEGDNWETGEPLAPMVRRWVNVKSHLLFGPAGKARDEYNAAHNSQYSHAVLWFPEPFHPEREDFDMLGGGQGEQNGSTVWIRPSPPPSAPPAGEYLNWGEHILAHELGHNHGLLDTYFDNTPPEKYIIPAWQAYVYYTAVNPSPESPCLGIMRESHAPNRLFFTDAEYAQIFFRLWNPGGREPDADAPAGELALRVSGAIGPGPAVRGIFSSISDETALSANDKDSPYKLRLGVGRTTLAETGFSPTYASPMDTRREGSESDDAPPEPYGQFSVLAAFPAGAGWAEIVYRTRSLWRLERSAHAPKISLLSPNGGERFASGARPLVSWHASDEDGDALMYSIHYSPDAGARWFPVTSGLRAKSFVWNTIGSPGGGGGLIRVRACDGFNSAEDTSDAPFSLAGQPPLAAILQPTSGTRFLQWEPIALVGEALDPDGLAMNAAWTIGSEHGSFAIDGLRVQAPPLDPGGHWARLDIEDSDGFAASREIVFDVLADSDRDGMDDAFEQEHAFDPGNAADALEDPDEDDLCNFEESRRGLNPRNSDSDGDGWSDGAEAAAGSDPRDPLSHPDSNRARRWAEYP